MYSAEQNLVRLIESVTCQELTRTQCEHAHEIFECLWDSVKDHTTEAMCMMIEDIDGIDYDEEKETYRVQTDKGA